MYNMNIPDIKIIILIVFSFLFFSEVSWADNIPEKQTSVKFELKKGGKLFFSYPLNEVKYQEIMMPVILKDTSFIIKFDLLKPFVVFDLNKSRTPYIFFPGNEYFCKITAEKSKIFFLSSDNKKSYEANLLSEIENKTGKFELSLNKSLTSLIYKFKIYSRSLDIAFLELYKKRFLVLCQAFANKAITSESYFYLKAYLDYELLSNRLIPFYYKNFEQSILPAWYRDSINSRRDYFFDSSNTNIYTFKKALIYYTKFNASELTSADNFLNQISVIRNYQFPVPVKNLVFYHFFIMNISQVVAKHSNYIDSFEVLISNSTFIDILKNRISFEILTQKRGQFKDSYLLNPNDQLFSLDSLLRTRAFYIDFWATWCLPCIQELPQYTKIKFCGNDFPSGVLFISIDSEIDKWKKAMLNYPFMNINNSFILVGGIESPFAIKNKLSEIPRHIIFNNQATPIVFNADGPSKDGFLQQLKTNKVIDCGK
jgi:thiol-disulfide isomerase/thioredoxin